MNVLQQFHFIRPAWLILLPAAGVLWMLVRRQQDPMRGWKAVMQPDLLQAVTIRSAISRWRGTWMLAWWLLAILSLAGPTWKPEPSPFADDPVPVMVLMHAGESMQQTDLTPDRMQRAQLKVVDFAKARPGQPMGLLAYAGTAHLVLPPTRDTSVVATMAEQISPEVMPQPGDNLLAAIELAATTIEETGGSLVIVTDTVADLSETKWNKIRTSIRSPIFFLAIARPDTPELKKIQAASRIVRGTVVLMTPDEEDIEALVRQTASAPMPVSDAAEETRWQESGWWLLPLIAILALVPFRRSQSFARADQEP